MGSAVKSVAGSVLGAIGGGSIGGIVGGAAGGGAFGKFDPFAKGGADDALAGAREQLSNEAFRQAQMLRGQEGDQKAFAKQLVGRAQGQGPSITEQQMRAASDRSLAQQIALAKSMRSANPGLVSRTVQNNASLQGQQIAQAAAQAKLQEQITAQEQYRNYLNQQQNNFATLASAQAGVAQGVNNTNMQGEQSRNQLIGSFLSAGGQAGAAMLSDERAKKDIKPGKKSAQTFLDVLSSHSYKYKDEKHGKGEQLSVMAQDLEKAGPVGKQMVVDTPEGKMVDYGKGFGAILAAQVELNKRLKQIESKRG